MGIGKYDIINVRHKNENLSFYKLSLTSLTPYKIFTKEIEELEKFYDYTLKTFEQTIIIQKNAYKLTKANPLFEQIIIPFTAARKKDKFQNDIRYFLRELIHIRLISALEVYLIDNIKHIFIYNKRPFKNTNPIKISSEQLLSSKSTTELFEKFINSECRQLSSGGFSKIISFYQNKFKLDLASISPGKSTLEEYHARRHLLVHRLGKTDLEYRSKYNTERKGLSITETYLSTAINDIKRYAEITNNLTIFFLKENQTPNKDKSNRKVSFKFEILNNESPEFINEDFTFWSNDHLISLNDILKEKSLINNSFEITVEGIPSKVHSYYRLAKRNVKGNKINYRSFQLTNWKENITLTPENKIKQKKTQIITKETIERIKSELTYPLKKDIHKNIAKKLKLSNKTVWTTISYILKNQS